MVFFDRNREKVAESGYEPSRLPPGQYLTERFPILHVGEVPTYAPGEWNLRVFGLVEKEFTLDLEQLRALPSVTLTTDIHCVTKWSKFDTVWKGVRVRDLLATAGLKLLGPFFLVIPGIIAAEMFGPAAIGNGDLAYSLLVDAVLPPYLVGLFAAVFLGSVISAFNGGLHSVSTMFSVDLYRGWLKPAASDREMVRAGKIFSVGIVFVSIFTSGLLGGSSEGIFTMMKQVMSAFKLPLLAVVVVGMISRRVPAWAANFSMVLGVFTSILLNSAFGDGFLGFRLKVSSLHVHWLHLAALNTILLCGFMLIIGRFAPARPAEVRVGATAAPAGPAVDLTPWSGLRVASIVVALAAIGLYFALWRVAGAR